MASDDSGDKIQIVVPDSPPRIEIQGPEEILRGQYSLYQEACREVEEDEDGPKIIDYFIKRGVYNLMGGVEFEYISTELMRRERENAYLLDMLRKSLTLYESEFRAARDVIGAVISLHSHVTRSPEPQCVYWGADVDEFAEELGPGWWRYVGQYSGRDEYIPTRWSDSRDEYPVWIRGRPRIIDFDVCTEGLPEEIPARSVDVALFKTIGSGAIQNPEIHRGFWSKMTATLKPGGLLITTDPIHKEFADQFEPYPPMVEAIGTHELRLPGTVYPPSIMHGYPPARFMCYRFRGK